MNNYNDILKLLQKINSIIVYMEYCNNHSIISKLNDRLKLEPIDHEFVQKILNIKK